VAREKVGLKKRLSKRFIISHESNMQPYKTPDEMKKAAVGERRRRQAALSSLV
jgi:hypothetical protein